MNGHKNREYETQCLIELLAAVANKEPVPEWQREPDWAVLYKLADYHDVANTIYGLLLGMDGKQLAKRKSRFEERYRFAVVMQERYQTAEREVLAAMERNKIYCMELQSAVLDKCYERREQRNPEPLSFFVEKGKGGLIQKAMHEIGFEKKAVRGKKQVAGETCYYRMVGTYVIFYESFFFTRKKMNRYFSIPPQDFPKRKGFRFIHQPDMEDFYLYYMAYITERYARGEIEIKDILDLWQYYISCYKQIEWKDIYKELKYLEIDVFADKIVKLAAMWFGRMGELEENLYQLYAMEDYILSKGVEAREENEELLPLVREVADIYERDLKKEQRKRQLELRFPKREYMEAIYPSLSKTILILPFCWVHRIVKSQCNKIKGMVVRRVQIVRTKKQEMIQNWKENRKKRKEEKEDGNRP